MSDAVSGYKVITATSTTILRWGQWADDRDAEVTDNPKVVVIEFEKEGSK